MKIYLELAADLGFVDTLPVDKLVAAFVVAEP